jgi:drug/metabolite transporter (DMT)-like permease
MIFLSSGPRLRRRDSVSQWRYEVSRVLRMTISNDENTSPSAWQGDANRKTPFYRPAVLAIIALSCIWGYNWVVMKECLRYSDAFDFAALRTTIGALSLFALLLWKRRPLRPKAFWMTALLGFVSTTACIGFVTLALATGGVGKTAILVYIMPFWVLLLAWPILAEHIRGIQWVPVILAFSGLMIVLEPWNLQSTFISKLFAVLAGVAWALSAIMTKIMTRNNSFDLISLTAWQMLLGALPLVLIALILSDRQVQWTPYFTMGLFYSSVVSQALALLLWFFILTKLPAGVASMGTLATPVIGTIAASIELGERPTIPEAWGMLLILAALTLLSMLGYVQHRQIQRVIASNPRKE